jgi:hypothetical protein
LRSFDFGFALFEAFDTPVSAASQILKIFAIYVKLSAVQSIIKERTWMYYSKNGQKSRSARLQRIHSSEELCAGTGNAGAGKRFFADRRR